jgi:hypothetical protein
MTDNSKSLREALDRYLQQEEHNFSDDTINRLTDFVNWINENPAPDNELANAHEVSEIAVDIGQNAGSSITGGHSSDHTSNVSSLSGTAPTSVDVVGRDELQRQEHVLDFVNDTGSSHDAYSQPQEPSYDGASGSSTLQGEFVRQESMDYSSTTGSTARSPGGNPQ